jgi:hypothetical protein
MILRQQKESDAAAEAQRRTEREGKRGVGIPPDMLGIYYPFDPRPLRDFRSSSAFRLRPGIRSRSLSRKADAF